MLSGNLFIKKYSECRGSRKKSALLRLPFYKSEWFYGRNGCQNDLISKNITRQVTNNKSDDRYADDTTHSIVHKTAYLTRSIPRKCEEN